MIEYDPRFFAVSTEELEVEVARRQAIEPPPAWPKTIQMYVHGSKESRYDDGAALGLTEEVLRNSSFRFTLSEVETSVLVSENGDATVLAFIYDGGVYERTGDATDA